MKQSIHHRKIVNLIGVGKVGKVLGRILSEQCGVSIGGIYCRTMEHAKEAKDFIGAGTAITELSGLPPATLNWITSADSCVEELCTKLLELRVLQPGSFLVHCSGALSREVFAAAADVGIETGSIHPVRSFADPLVSYQEFAGTFCGIEGSSTLFEFLESLLHPSGARLFTIRSEGKRLYHAGAVFASNYLVSIFEIALQCYQRAGVTPEMALEILASLSDGTLHNLMQKGPVDALTGPIVRGDWETVANQQKELGLWKEDFRQIYDLLGKIALDLTERRGELEKEKITSLQRLFPQ